MKKMKKIIKLTESDLVRLIKQVIREDDTLESNVNSCDNVLWNKLKQEGFTVEQNNKATISFMGRDKGRSLITFTIGSSVKKPAIYIEVKYNLGSYKNYDGYSTTQGLVPNKTFIDKCNSVFRDKYVDRSTSATDDFVTDPYVLYTWEDGPFQGSDRCVKTMEFYNSKIKPLINLLVNNRYQKT